MTADTLSPAAPGARKFRAANMADALNTIQAELGPEALIVSVRQVPDGPAWQVWRKPVIEVVAMPSAVAATPTLEVRAPKPAAPSFERIDLARRETARSAAPAAPAPKPAARQNPTPRPARWPAALDELRVHLSAQGLDTGLTQTVLATCAETLNPRAQDDRARVREHIQQQLEAHLRAWGSPALASPARPGAGPRVVCLVGPSGSGKTSMAAKLAAHHTRNLGLRVAWICADTYRAGAIAQARIYAESLRLPLRVAYTGAELAQAADAEKDSDLILVDTPGCNPRREASLVELGELLTALPTRVTYLVAPATAKDEDLADAVSAFGAFDLKGLLLTKLDETATFGALYNLAWRSRLPLLFYSSGPGVLDTLEPASAAPLVRALLNADPASLEGGAR